MSLLAATERLPVLRRMMTAATSRSIVIHGSAPPRPVPGGAVARRGGAVACRFSASRFALFSSALCQHWHNADEKEDGNREVGRP